MEDLEEFENEQDQGQGQGLGGIENPDQNLNHTVDLWFSVKCYYAIMTVLVQCHERFMVYLVSLVVNLVTVVVNLVIENAQNVTSSP